MLKVGITRTTHGLEQAFTQHKLICKHNLNLKTQQLETFTNTQQLHNLLEPNIHTLGIN